MTSAQPGESHECQDLHSCCAREGTYLIMLLEMFTGGMGELHRHKLVALFLKASDDIANEAPLDPEVGVRSGRRKKYYYL
jgi:hypothetical protein